MILVIGRPDSGKSAKAEELAMELSFEDKRIYLATMIPCGREGVERVEKHRKLRAGKGFLTVERPFDVGDLPDDEEMTEGIRASEATVLLECAVNLCANVMFEKGSGRHEKMSAKETALLVTEDIFKLKDRVKDLIVVTNEFEPEDSFDEDTKRYTDAVSRINAALRERSDRVYDITGGEWKVYEND